MGYAITAEVTLETLTCAGCGITYAIPSQLHYQYTERGATVNCPNPKCPWGGMVRRETKEQKLEKQLNAAREARRWAEESLEGERRSHAATKGHLTRTKRRVAGGVCPCCQRSFQNLKRHMANQHPDFAKEPA